MREVSAVTNENPEKHHNRLSFDKVAQIRTLYFIVLILSPL